MKTLTKKRESELRLKMAQAFRNQYNGCGEYKGLPNDTEDDVKRINSFKNQLYVQGLDAIQEISDELKQYGMYIDVSNLEFIKDPFAKK